MVAVLFPTLTFAVFFAVVLAVGWRLSDQPVQWKLFMVVASYVFYGWWDPVFCLLLAGATVGNQLVAKAIGRSGTDRTARAWMILGVVGDLAILGFFKYYGFFVDSLIGLLEPVGLAPTSIVMRVVLPVGVSFFLFCAISYLVDVYRQHQEPIGFLDFAVYLSFFPHLVAGPIVRVSEFAPQLARRRNPDSIDATRAVRLICRGLFKKVVIANFLATAIVDPVFAAPSSATNLELAVGAWAYAVQIYADFSGYTDIAIGVALMLGIKFPQNFDRPYSATSLQDFWRRWHMTLSRWLRDYVYIPLGGNRGGKRAEERNLVITMGLGGLWHGASWNFVIWGLLHGFGLVTERWWRERPPRVIDLRDRVNRGDDDENDGRGDPGERPRGAPPARSPWLPSSPSLRLPRRTSSIRPAGPSPSGSHDTTVMARPDIETDARPMRTEPNPWISRLIVFNFVTFAWIFFRAPDLPAAFAYLTGLVTNWGVGTMVTPMVVVAIVVGLAGQFVPPRLGDALEYRASRLPAGWLGIGVGLWLVVINLLGPQGIAPFIYFQF